MEFQRPAPLNLQQQNTLPQSIDALFNMYQQSRLTDSHLADAELQRQASRASFSLQNQGLEPEDVNRLLPQALQPAQGYTYPVGSRGEVIATPPPQEDPKVGVLRNILALHMQGQQLGAAQQVAGLGLVQGQAAKAQADAAVSQAEANALGGGTGRGPSLIDSMIGAVNSGKISPDKANEYMSRNPAMHLAYLKALTEGHIPVNEIQNAADQKSELAKLNASGQVQIPVRMGQAILPNLDKLDQLADKNAGGSWQSINRFGINLAAEKGDRGANAINTQAAIISDEVQAMFGSGSDSKLDLAVKLLSTAKTKEQLKDSTDILRTAIKNRINSLQGNPENPKPGKLQNIGRFSVEFH